MRGIPAVGGRTSHRYQYMPFTSYQVPDTVPGLKKNSLRLSAKPGALSSNSFIPIPKSLEYVGRARVRS